MDGVREIKTGDLVEPAIETNAAWTCGRVLGFTMVEDMTADKSSVAILDNCGRVRQYPLTAFDGDIEVNNGMVDMAPNIGDFVAFDIYKGRYSSLFGKIVAMDEVPQTTHIDAIQVAILCPGGKIKKRMLSDMEAGKMVLIDKAFNTFIEI